MDNLKVLSFQTLYNNMTYEDLEKFKKDFFSKFTFIKRRFDNKLFIIENNNFEDVIKIFSKNQDFRENYEKVHTRYTCDVDRYQLNIRCCYCEIKDCPEYKIETCQHYKNRKLIQVSESPINFMILPQYSEDEWEKICKLCLTSYKIRGEFIYRILETKIL